MVAAADAELALPPDTLPAGVHRRAHKRTGRSASTGQSRFGCPGARRALEHLQHCPNPAPRSCLLYFRKKTPSCQPGSCSLESHMYAQFDCYLGLELPATSSSTQSDSFHGSFCNLSRIYMSEWSVAELYVPLTWCVTGTGFPAMHIVERMAWCSTSHHGHHRSVIMSRCTD